MMRRILDKAKYENQKLTAGENTLYKLHYWMKEQDRESIIALDHHGKINKQKLKAQSGVNPRAVQSQNPVAAKLMRRMERHWRSLGLLSALVEPKAKPQVSSTNTDTNSGTKEPEYQDPRDAEIARLQAELSKEKALNYQKDIQLARYKEWQEVFYREGFGYTIHGIALSGRAALRLFESIRMPTKTITRFLGDAPLLSEDEEGNKIKHLVVIDESSMVDTY
ncbi:AAA family ATPase [Vibrio vulnificus]|uniref:AAA family ATPase n=1 Tax=Vibrio parahaemolyticus TaxID=670 RepID=UPI00084A9911|nr:AAA family ATPase [Vibrio parahaemolyticus]ELB7642948.1 AAA family ATPase [Vibrio vulnificus]ELX4135744.1 AAA family ATPase [Vibrio vulnificus]ELX4197111.1 AAA family ATPase [Vibrio vulnificus]ODW79222.1 hypothetical protein BBL92_07150 [Vibrio parahaemolyticus]